MSSEFYIQGYHQGEFAGIARALVLDAFGLAEDTPDDGIIELRYSGNDDCGLSFKTTGNIVTSLCIHRPSEAPALLNSLFQVLNAGHYVLYAPGGNAPVVTQNGMTAHLPKDMVDALGKPVVVDGPDGILDALFGGQ